jgi:hypothetical protein
MADPTEHLAKAREVYRKFIDPKCANHVALDGTNFIDSIASLLTEAVEGVKGERDAALDTLREAGIAVADDLVAGIALLVKDADALEAQLQEVTAERDQLRHHLAKMIEYAEDHQDVHNSGDGWKSDELKADIRAAKSALKNNTQGSP